MAPPLPQHQQAPPQTFSPWPLYDLFLDVPHPAVSPGCPPIVITGAPDAETISHDRIEQELSKSLPQIARFAFPEYDQDTSPPPPPQEHAPPINRFDQYAMQPPAFQNYTFSLTLQSGMRVYGHVRRYLPCHKSARGRYDVGRRGERALVLMSRVTGADVIYAAVLKTIDAISNRQIALPQYANQDEPQRTFLHDLFRKHQRIAGMYSSTERQPVASIKPVFLTIQDLETGQEGAQKFSTVDSTHFLLTLPLLVRTSMGDLVSNTSNASILPVLRCLGVAHTLRLLCALLSERRVILISASPTRLATCCKSAIAMLAQGLLHWQHLYIPVLPPHLWQYLAAPYPYLIGILASLTPRLDRTDGLGEVLLIDLDQNTMETRGIPTDLIQERIPDLLRNMNYDSYNVQMKMQQLGSDALPPSAPEMLAQDLVELMKNDKKILYGESTLASMQDTAVKATKAVKATFFKLKEKGKKYLAQKSSSYNESDPKEEDPEPEEPQEVNSMSPDFIYTEGCRNAFCEEEARLAFCTFFLSTIGNMRWYLSAHPGQPPQLDRQRFLQQKRAAGDGEYSAMWPLLQSFCQTQMLEEFAKLRVEEMRTRQPVTNDSPLFLQCSNYHHQYKIDFNLLSIRRVARQVLQSNPSTMLQQTNARQMAMDLTSKRAFEGDYNKALADLVEQCRESSSVLFDVMSVVWIRMRDNKGLQWRHAVHSLHILKNLLFHGPLAAVAEATDGLDKIRALKYYNGNRQANICTQIRTSATQVYSLVVDRSKLFHVRRVCISKRRSMKKQDEGRLMRDTRLLKVPSTTFQKVHAAMHPNAPRSTPAPRTPPPSAVTQAYNATPTFAVLPPAREQQQAARSTAPSQPSEHDLLGLQEPQAASAVPVPSAADTDIFGMFAGSAQQQPPSAPTSGGSDMLGLFSGMTLGNQSASLPQQSANPYPIQQQTQPPSHYGAGAQKRAMSPQQLRSHSTSPIPPQHKGQAQSGSPPPQISQQQHGGNPFSLQPLQHQAATQYLNPPSASLPLSSGVASASIAAGAYQAQPGRRPSYAQPALPGAYDAQTSPHPHEGLQQPNPYAYQAQQQPQGQPYQQHHQQQAPPQQRQSPFF